MTTATAVPGNTANTFLTHLFGSGLSDDRYVVEKFKALLNGDIRRCPDDPPARGGKQRRTGFPTATLKAVREMRPARTEIIICTGIRTRGGVQIWGDLACGFRVDRRQRG